MKNLDIGKIIRWGLVIIAVGLVVSLFVWNAVTPQEEKSIETWEPEMTMGNANAENHFIEYVDMMCPYCSKFHFALQDNYEEFERDYLNTNKIYYELRLADMIEDHNKNSHRGNIAGYCATEQEGKFWGLYDTFQRYLTDNYYSKGIGSKVGEAEIPEWDNQVFYDLAENSGLEMEAFRDCFDNEKPKETLEKNTSKTQASMSNNSISGVPYFIYNNYVSSGFDGNYSTIKQMFKAGGAI